MYGLLIALVAVLGIALTTAAPSPSRYRYNGDVTQASGNGSGEEEAAAIAAALQWGLADATAACVNSAAAPASCRRGATSGGIVTLDGAGGSASIPLLNGTSPLGRVVVYFTNRAGPTAETDQPILMATWVPPSAAAGKALCMKVLASVMANTDYASRVAAYNAPTASVNHPQREVRWGYDGKARPLLYAAASVVTKVTGDGQVVTDGCPILVEAANR